MAVGSLGKTSVAAALYVGVAQAFRIAMTLLSTVIVSRILLPGDYGVIAMAAPITGFIMMFQDLGINQAVIQARTITPQQSNSFFWVNMGVAFLTALLMVVLHPLVSIFYHDSRAGYIVAASAFTVVLTASALQHVALMNREMRFAAISIIDMASATCTLVVTIAAALWLRSYWALWLGAAMGAAVTAILMWSASRWRPSWRFSFRGIGAMLKFGSSLGGFNLLNFLSRNLDNVIIARARGSQEVGLYDNSYKLMMFPLQNISAPLGRVMLPVLVRLRDEPQRYRRAFLLALRALMVAAMPIIAISAAVSDQLIVFLLGEKWRAAGPIFFWLSLTGILAPVANATGWLFVTSGRGGAMFRWGIFSAIVTIGGFLVGIHWGAYGVALSLFVGTLFRIPFLYSYSTIGTSLAASDLYKVMVAPLISGAITATLAVSLSTRLPITGLLAIVIPSGYVLAVLAQGCSRDGRELLSASVNIMKGISWVQRRWGGV